jgi:hypothetical protein
VALTVTDDDGSVDTATAQVTATSAQQTVIAQDATWSWRYEDSAPPTGWNTPAFDASGWNTGAAPLGFGDNSVRTNIDSFVDPTTRPRAVYAVRRINVADASKVTRLVLSSLADDGVVLYVNGTEVARRNMPTGPVSYLTFATAPVATSRAERFEVEVPPSLLVNGTNVIAAETHLNYRRTPDMTFHLEATLTIP